MKRLGPESTGNRSISAYGQFLRSPEKTSLQAHDVAIEKMTSVLLERLLNQTSTDVAFFETRAGGAMSSVAS